MKSALITLLAMVWAADLVGQTVGSIKPPPGWKPVLREEPGGAWTVSFIPDRGGQAGAAGTAVAAASRQGAAGSPAASAGSTAGLRKKQQLETQLIEVTKNLDWNRELNAIPAFVALDVTPETVTRPTTPRDLAAALINGVDRDGVLQTGIALETAPYQLFFGRETSLAEYRESYLTKLMYRTSLSLATTKAGSGADDHAQRLAFGISTTLLDAGDPYDNEEIDALREEVLRRNAAPSAADVAASIRPDMTADEMEEAVRENEAVRQFTEAGAAAANAEFIEGLNRIRETQWGRTIWNIAWAPAWLSPTGKAGDLRYDGSTLWTTFGYGFSQPALKNKLQLLGHVRFRESEHVVDDDDATRQARQDSLLAAASLRIHFERHELNFAAEAAYMRIWNGLDGDEDAHRIGAVLEKKIADGVWLGVSIGHDFGGREGENELFALSALRFGTADQARFGPE